MALLAGAALTATHLAVALDWSGLQPLGDVQSVTRHERGVTLACADGSALTVTFLTPAIVRTRAQFAGQPAAPDHSWAVARTDWPAVTWQLAETADAVTLRSDVLDVRIQRSPLLVSFIDPATGRVINADARPAARDPQSGRIGVAKKLGLDEHFYGLGEKAARLDKRRGRFTMWTSDTPGYVEGTDPIYQSVPFYLGLEHGVAYGIFHDNAHRSTFEFGHLTQESVDYSVEGGELNAYFFAGPALKDVVSRFTELTGRMPLPPLWALGHQQSRYSYYPDTMVEQIVAQYRARDLPLDVIHLDIHYMAGYRVFTWDRARFPDPTGLTRRLAEQGVRVVTIVDPGVKHQPPAAGAHDAAIDRDLAPQDQSYYVYNEGLAADYFLRQRDGSHYIGEVWPGKSVFVDYTKEAARRWWGDLQHASLTARGVAGIWTDMNEPADFLDPTGRRHEHIVFDDLGRQSAYAGHRNLFALHMARATFEGLARHRPAERPFVITRAGYAGIQRYAVKWTGDNNATFASVALNIPMFASLGLSGQPFVGADVPGFIGRGSGELLARAYQVAAFAPFFRNHTAIDQYDKEPWRFGAHYEAIVRKYIQLRYRLLPYLYTTIEEAHRTGVPLWRPPILNFQADENTANLDDQFMIGDALLVAPVLREGERGREVYLPTGALWHDFWTGAPHRGGDMLRIDAPLDHLPIFVRAGSIVPSTVAMNHTGEKPWDPLRFDVWPDAGGEARGELYEDDGRTTAHRDGAFRRTQLSFTANRLTLAPEGAFAPPAREFEVAFRGVTAREVRLDGDALPAAQWRQTADGVLLVRFADPGRACTVELR